jgi:hypothetical protein
MQMTDILSVVIAGIASAILGYVWYHPRLFGTSWMRMSRLQPEHAAGKGEGVRLASLGLFCSIVMAALIRSEIRGATVLGPALLHTAFLWLGCIATVLLGTFLWERKPLSLYLITAGYWFASMLLMAVILFYLHA